jgi:hypothetical protein
MQPVMNYSDECPLDTLILAVYPSPDHPSSYSLYEDDGISLEYQNGSFARTNFTQTISSGSELEISISASTGNFSGKLSERIILSDVHHIGIGPTSVIKNGLPLIQRLSYYELRNNTDGYFYDEDKKRLFVQIKVNTGSSYQINASGIILDSQSLAEIYPKEAKLKQNYPNPFNSNTKIEFTLPSNIKREKSNVILKIYDVLGNEVMILVNEEKSAGNYKVEWNAGSLPSGIYFYRLQTDLYRETKKMVLLR